MSVVVKYNGTSIVPAPTVNEIRRTYNRTEAGLVIGTEFAITLSGRLIQVGDFTQLIADKQALAELFGCAGHNLTVTCNDVELINACVSQVDIAFKETADNWASSIIYEVVLLASTINTMGACVTGASNLLTSLNDSWNITEAPECFYHVFTGEEAQPKIYQVSRNISAQARNSCATGNDGWTIAKTYVDSVVALDTGLFFTEISASCMTGYNIYDEARVANISKISGVYELQQTWLLKETTTGTNSNPITETFDITVTDSADSTLSTVSISGLIQGHESVTYSNGCKTVTANKHANAVAYWSTLQSNIHGRLSTYSGLTLNPYPSTKTHMVSPKIGQIKYDYVFDTRQNCLTAPTGCSIRREEITLSEKDPSDVYGETYILGRPCPLITCMGIKTKGSRTLNVDTILDCGAVCAGDPDFFLSPIAPAVATLVNACYANLTGSYGTVVVDNDHENWDPQQGRYARSVTWSYADCCTVDNTGEDPTSSSQAYLSGSYSMMMYSQVTFTGSDSGSIVTLPRAGSVAGKYVTMYNTSTYDIRVAKHEDDSYTTPVDTSIETGTGITATVASANTWTLTNIPTTP